MFKNFQFSWLLLSKYRQYFLPITLFLALVLNIVIAPLVLAGSGNVINKESAYAIGILLLISFALSIYLFFVIFYPEKF